MVDEVTAEDEADVVVDDLIRQYFNPGCFLLSQAIWSANLDLFELFQRNNFKHLFFSTLFIDQKNALFWLLLLFVFIF